MKRASSALIAIALRSLLLLPLLLLLPSSAHAQYASIPNETAGVNCPASGTISDITQCPGYKTLKDIDARFNGSIGLSPSYSMQSIAASGAWPATVEGLYVTTAPITITLPACSAAGLHRTVMN